MSLSNALITLKNNEARSNTTCQVKASKLVQNVLQILKREKYVADYERVEDGKQGLFNVKLSGRINNCKAVPLRYAISHKDIIKWEKRFLPAAGFGHLIISTPQGIMTNEEVKSSKIGGRLLAYVY